MAFKKIVDLTHEIHEGMLTFNASWHTKVSIKILGRHEKEGRVTREMTLGTHAGTHTDAPLHFIVEGKSIDEIPLEKLVGQVTIVDFSDLSKDAEVTEKMLEKTAIGKKMLFKFGWGKHWNTDKFYHSYPFFSKEAAEFLVEKGVEMIALDTPSPDDSRIKLSGDILGSDRDSPIHKIFLQAGVVLVEYVANLEKLEDCENWNIVVAPLKIKGADGSPARVFLFK